ncbi:MAG: IS66 family insertion sequence element accessory protein TnpB [Bacteroidaceae bacterium]|nr:IS66 family insertion sequence element accessory protein TnpB [Bacteroidaceae bacterium]
MFNLNENNRIVIAQQPTDMRKDVNTLCGQVRMLGLDPADGKVYIFVSSSRKVMKILHWEHDGYVVYYKDKNPNEKHKHCPTPYRTEIVRRMSTQKTATVEAVNALGEIVQVRLCSTPRKEAADIYEMLRYKKMPFWKKIKVCSTQ